MKLQKLSISQVNQFLQCPRSWLYFYYYGLKLEKNENLYFGSVIHEGLAALYSGKDPIETIVHYIKKGSWEKPRLADESAFTDEALRIMAMYMSKGIYLSPKKDWIEKKVVLRLTHPTTKEEIPIPFTFKIDLITNDGYIVDHKTAGSVPKEQNETNKYQGIAYQMAYRKLFGKAPRGFVQNTIVKQKRNPRVVPEVFQYSVDDEIMLFELVKNVVHLIETDRAYTAWPMIRTHYPCQLGILCDIHS